jgi:antirestriction protein ArdC
MLVISPKPLEDDKREIFRAAAAAQRIAETVLGFHPQYIAQVQTEPLTPAPIARETRQGPMPS